MLNRLKLPNFGTSTIWRDLRISKFNYLINRSSSTQLTIRWWSSNHHHFQKIPTPTKLMKTRDQVLLRRRLIIKVKMRIILRLNLNITQLIPLSRWLSLIKIMRWWWWDLLAKEAIKLYKYYQCRMRLNKTSSRRSKIILTSFFLYHSIKRRKEYRINRPANLMSSIKSLLSKINSLKFKFLRKQSKAHLKQLQFFIILWIREVLQGRTISNFAPSSLAVTVPGGRSLSVLRGM